MDGTGCLGNLTGLNGGLGPEILGGGHLWVNLCARGVDVGGGNLN